MPVLSESYASGFSSSTEVSAPSEMYPNNVVRGGGAVIPETEVVNDAIADITAERAPGNAASRNAASRNAASTNADDGETSDDAREGDRNTGNEEEPQDRHYSAEAVVKGWRHILVILKQSTTHYFITIPTRR